MAHPASEHQSVLSSILSRSAAAPQEAFFLIFFSDFDQAKGLMWCPDCVDAVPLVEAYQRSNPKHNLEIQYVGDKTTWRSPESVFRKAPYGLNCIPTLLKFVNGKEVDRLPEPGLLDAHQFKAFVQSS